MIVFSATLPCFTILGDACSALPDCLFNVKVPTDLILRSRSIGANIRATFEASYRSHERAKPFCKSCIYGPLNFCLTIEVG